MVSNSGWFAAVFYSISIKKSEYEVIYNKGLILKLL